MKKILGIDPGTTRIGYGLINANGSDLQYLSSGLIEITSTDREKRLLELADGYDALLKKEKPDLVSLEKLYFVKNIKTGMDVAQARGVLLLLTRQNRIPLVEYTPSEVKLNVAGSGNADKMAVAKMVKLILKIDEIKGPDDVSDAVAIAIVAANNIRFQ